MADKDAGTSAASGDARILRHYRIWADCYLLEWAANVSILQRASNFLPLVLFHEYFPLLFESYILLERRCTVRVQAISTSISRYYIAELFRSTTKSTGVQVHSCRVTPILHCASARQLGVCACESLTKG